MKGRIQIYPPEGPGKTAYIIGDHAGLKELARVVNDALFSAAKLETTKLHSSDGHEYTCVVTHDISEDEWQINEPNYKKDKPANVEIIKTFNEIYGKVRS